MPIISQPTVLPYQPTLRDKLLDALIASAPQFAMTALTGGFNLGSVPRPQTPQRPGQLQFPSGAMTNTSPDELAQLQAMGGVPNRQGGMVPFGTGAPNAVSYQPPTRWGIRPNLDLQTKQLNLQKLQQDVDPNSPMNQYLKSLTPQASGPGQPTETRPTEDNEFLRGLESLGAQADAGDERAVQKIRLIRQLMAAQ